MGIDVEAPNGFSLHQLTTKPFNQNSSRARRVGTMMSRAFRTSSSLVARLGRNATPSTRRTFVAATLLRQPDIVQDLYLRELRAYKLPAVKATDAEGHVQKFNMPKPPKSPEETAIANQMQEYESSAVEIEGQTSTGESEEPEGDYFEDIEASDEQQPAAH